MHKFKLLLITILLAVNANGQSPNTPVLESSVYELPDYIVTGTLWNTPIQNVPQSVTLFSETAVEDRQALYFQDLVNAVPNLTMTGGNNRARYFQLRGMGENSQFEGETPDLSVRFLIDDFDFTGIGGIASLFDLKQVEVIRGAQSSAYGVNASAGIIKLSTNEANSEEATKAKLSLGTHNQRSLGYATGGILGDKATSKTNYRLSIFQNNTDGFIENENLNRSDTNKSSEFFSLLKLKHNLSNDSSILTSFVYADAKGGYDQWSLNNTYLKTQSDNPGEDNQRSKGISVRMNSKNFDNFSITSVSTILNTDSIYSYDSDWGNLASYTSGYDGFLSIDRNRKSQSQEIRVDSSENLSVNALFSKWTAGIYFSNLSEETNFNYSDLNPDNTPALQAIVKSDYNTQSISAFSKAEYLINKDSMFTFGLRAEYLDTSFSSTTDPDNDYDGNLSPTNSVLNNDTLFGGSINYQNKVTADYTLFLSYNHGYKAAGVNSTSFRPVDSSFPITFDTEKINTYEIGLVYLNPKKTYQAKLNLFYLARKNAQLRDAGGSKGFFTYFTSNQGDATHYGAEYQSQWNFTPNWSFENNISLLKARIDESHRDLGNAPSYKFSCLLKYNPNNAFYSSISINGSDDYYEENGHDLKREAYTIVNASIGYAKNHWDISLWAKNLFDHDFTQRVFYFDNYHPEDNYADDSKRFYKASGDPLNYGVTINYDW
jgi:outer membrane receptor protein involved in Fe transport